MRRTIPAVTAALLLAGCAFQGSPIPVRGDVQPLVGEWVGDYSSRETGRVGSIVFRLQAGTDTASGDVLMIPTNPEPQPTMAVPDPGPARRPPQLLRVSFVRCEGSAVTGWLDPYPDPDTGEKTWTTFDGVIKGDKLEGTFTSYTELSGRRATGRWSVTRKKPAP
jgi:hypothetical protein